MTKFQSQVGFDFSHFYQLYQLSRHTITKQNVLNHKKVLDHTGQFRASLNFELWCIHLLNFGFFIISKDQQKKVSIDFILILDFLFCLFLTFLILMSELKNTLTKSSTVLMLRLRLSRDKPCLKTCIRVLQP